MCLLKAPTATKTWNHRICPRLTASMHYSTLQSIAWYVCHQAFSPPVPPIMQTSVGGPLYHRTTNRAPQRTGPRSACRVHSSTRHLNHQTPDHPKAISPLSAKFLLANCVASLPCRDTICCRRLRGYTDPPLTMSLIAILRTLPQRKLSRQISCTISPQCKRK